MMCEAIKGNRGRCRNTATRTVEAGGHTAHVCKVHDMALGVRGWLTVMQTSGPNLTIRNEPGSGYRISWESRP